MKLLETFYKLDHTCCLNSGTLKYGIITEDETDRDCRDVEELADCLDDLEKVVKAMEIIKAKEVDAFLVIDCPNVGHYNRHFEYSNVIRLQRCLTEEEFKLLKEVLL